MYSGNELSFFISFVKIMSTSSLVHLAKSDILSRRKPQLNVPISRCSRIDDTIFSI